MRIMKQLLNDRGIESLTENNRVELVDEIEDTYRKLVFLKTGMETTLTKLTAVHRDLKRAGQHNIALDIHAEMLFVGRMIATIDVLFLEEFPAPALEEIFDT